MCSWIARRLTEEAGDFNAMRHTDKQTVKEKKPEDILGSI